MPPTKMKTRLATRKEEREASREEEEREAARNKMEELEAARKAKKLKMRQDDGLFVRKDKVIRRNDMITDPIAQKIKLEPDESATPPVVKQEAEELQQEEGTSDKEIWQDYILPNVDAAVMASPPTAIASTSAQCGAEILQTPLQEKQVAVKIESPGALQADQVVVMSELDIPNDDDREEEVGEESFLSLGTPGEKVLRLFPDVLNTIILNEPKVFNCVHWRPLMPLLTACRLVCKSWKDSVDRILQQDSSHLALDHSYLKLSDRKRDFTPCPLQISYQARASKARWAEELERIRCHVMVVNPSYNPIPSRHLMLTGPLPKDLCSKNFEKWANYCEIVNALLEQVGQQVWYLTVDFYGGIEYSLEDVTVLCNCLCEWFSLLPNLRSLSLGARFRAPLNIWQKALERISIPKFEHLETLAFGGMQRNRLYYTILENNRHVNRLSLVFRSVPEPVSMELDLPNLSTLNCTFATAEEWEQFVNSAAAWKLQDLSVQFCGYKRGKRRPTAAQFAEGVAKFGRTLKILTFSPFQIGAGTGEDLELKNLPLLKSLLLATREWYGFKLEVRLASLQSLESYSMELSITPGSIFPSQYINLSVNPDYYDGNDCMKLPKLRNVNISVKVDGRNIGEQDVVVKRRENMPSVIFRVPKMNNN